MVNNLPAMPESRVELLDQEDPRRSKWQPHSRVLAWRIPWVEEPGELLSTGSQRVRHN